MKFYFLNDGDDAPYYAKLTDAKKDARIVAKDSYHDITVQRVEISTDRENVLRMLNGSGGTTQFLEIVYTAKAGLKKRD